LSPRVGRASVAPDRVQGIDSSLNDLTLRDGREVAVELGGAIEKGAKLVRTISGGSSVQLSVRDHALGYLDASLAAESFDAMLDGLHFRYMGADLGESSIGLTLKDRDIAALEEITEPYAAYRKDMTRARFIVNAVRKARPNADITCPEIDVVQPIKTERQGKKAAAEAKAKRGKGIGAAKGLTVKGSQATPEQIEIGERAARTIGSHKGAFRVGVAVFAALIVESEMGALSDNYMQMTGTTKTGSRFKANVIEEAVTGFLTGYLDGEEGAIEYFKGHPDAEPFQIAQAVQKSGAGLASDGAGNYGPWVAEARAWIEAFEGGEFSAEGGSRTVTEPFKYEFDPEHDDHWWDMIKRLAGDVNWRAFWVAGRFFYIDEIDLFRGMVRLAIDRETPGIQSVTGRWRKNRPATDITITAFATEWKVPPGAVVTVAGYGPFSIGFGDAPLKKGQVGISGNRVAATGVGRARYLLETIEIPLRDSDTSGLKLITCKLRKPTAPLPEPAAETKTVSTKSGGAGFPGGSGEMGVLEGTPEEIVNQVVDYAHANGFPAVTRATVRAANATHGPTVSGGRSDHQGPPETAWAADISNGTTTPEEDALAQAISDAFDIPWNGSGLVTVARGKYEIQLIYRTMEGGDHFTHVHFGCHLA
jgi:hypothetical protein